MKKLILIPVLLLSLSGCTTVPIATQVLGASLGAILASQAIDAHEKKNTERAQSEQLETIMRNRKLPQ